MSSKNWAMAKKPAIPKRRAKRKPSRKTDPALQLVKILGALSILLLLVVSAGLLMRGLLRRPATNTPPVAHMPVPPAEKTAPPTYEVYPPQEPSPEPLDKLDQLPGDHPPLVAIVIDDIGYDRRIASKLLSLDAPLTFSVLPYGPFSQEIAARARSKGHEIMLHLPMEPKEFPTVNPGPGALLTQMAPDQFIGQLKADIDRIPGLKGVNNHMGSAVSTSSERMRQIFTILKKNGLYYIDSRTTAETVARPSAELLQIPFAERDIFIDHLENPRFIRKQLHNLIKRAQRQGYAVGIAHPHAVTFKVLAELLPEIKKSVELVPASMVIDTVMLAQAQKTHAQRDSGSSNHDF
jgi:polysaccharide deacetylase 2 family uncharacterized protein YibQ